MATPGPFSIPDDEMERLQEELKEWKASSIKHIKLWILAERHLEDL